MTTTLRTPFFAAALFAGLSLPAAAGEFCEDKADGTYASPDECSQFIYCGGNGAIEAAMDCPAGLLWSDDAQYCDWPENVTCEQEAFLPELTRVSVSSEGEQADDGSQLSAISDDGQRVVFQTRASNLVAGDTNGRSDIFVHSMASGTTVRVSVSTDGTEANGHSYEPDISADGRFVAFYSYANNLVEGVTSHNQLYVHDLLTGTTEHVSVNAAGETADGAVMSPSLSADGRYVAAVSRSSNLFDGDADEGRDIVVFDRETGEVTLVSVSSDGVMAEGYHSEPDISADGSIVTFMGRTSTLVDDDEGDIDDIFVHNLRTSETTRVSVSTDGVQSNGYSYDPSISADGRLISFLSYADNLVEGDTNDMGDIFVVDTQTGALERVSTSSDGAESNGQSSLSRLSADGRFVAFHSRASNLVAGDTNDEWDIFVHDRDHGTTERISINIGGEQGNDTSRNPSISGDGQFVSFYSYADNLVEGDTNDEEDIFVQSPMSFYTNK